MGNGQGAPFLNLFSEDRDHTPVTAQDIPETDCSENGIPPIHRLDHQFTHPLGRSHDIGRAHRLVR